MEHRPLPAGEILDRNGAANLLPVPAPAEAAGAGDTLDLWAEHYFRFEVTTSARSQQEQRRDLALFLRFMEGAAGTLQRSAWTPRLSRAFVEALRKELHPDGSRHYSDRTINRIAAHLKTFAKWIQKLRPFPLGNPTEKLKGLALNGVLELERALTEDERRRLLDAADHLPVLGGRSRDRRRCKDIEFPDERPRRKGYRPWRNRAIIYCLIETGMRRAEVTSIDLATIDFDHHTLLITEKGGRQRKCQISKEGLKAIRDYVREERGNDAEMFPQSPALFLPADTVVRSSGRLTPAIINRLWNDVCLSARVKGRTPHSARHAMGVHLVKKTGNPRTAQRQLGHKNPSTTMQYMQFTRKEMQEALDDR
jgi:integrase/recombinase XerC